MGIADDLATIRLYVEPHRQATAHPPLSKREVTRCPLCDMVRLLDALDEATRAAELYRALVVEMIGDVERLASRLSVYRESTC